MDFALSEEQELLRDSVRALVARHADRNVVRELEVSRAFPRTAWKELGRLDVLGLTLEEADGGAGGSVADLVVVLEELARASLALAIPIVTTVSQGSKVISHLGTPAQKHRFLPPLLAGELLTTLAWTEPAGGSDVLAMSTSATRTPSGWRLDGTKTFITLADKADVILTVARSRTGVERRSDGISCFAVPAGADGLTIRPIEKVGQRGTTFCEVHLENVLVAEDALLGTEGASWKELVPLLSSERTCFAAICVGLAKAAFDDALAYVHQRTAFGKTIAHFQALQHHLVDMHRLIVGAELVVHRAAWLESAGRPYAMDATEALLVASEMASTVTDLGVQLLGGYGLTEEFDMERYWRDARVFRVSPVTSDVAKNVIAQQLGLPRSF